MFVWFWCLSVLEKLYPLLGVLLSPSLVFAWLCGVVNGLCIQYLVLVVLGLVCFIGLSLRFASFLSLVFEWLLTF